MKDEKKSFAASLDISEYRYDELISIAYSVYTDGTSKSDVVLKIDNLHAVSNIEKLFIAYTLGMVIEKIAAR
jgi:hypothetical protein